MDSLVLASKNATLILFNTLYTVPPHDQKISRNAVRAALTESLPLTDYGKPLLGQSLPEARHSPRGTPILLNHQVL